MPDTSTSPPAHPLSLRSALTFVGSVLLQVGGISLWPLTRGFSQPLPTVACIAAQLAAVFLLCRLLDAGVRLSTVIPLASAVTPLAVSAIGVVFYEEPASATTAALLVGACALIGLAR